MRKGEAPPADARIVHTATIATGPRAELRIGYGTYGGRAIVGARMWYANKAGELRPSYKGFMLELETAREALAGMSEAVRGLETIQAGDVAAGGKGKRNAR